MRRFGACSGVAILAALMAGFQASAAPIGHASFRAAWQRTDKPVADLLVNRTWMWGPEASSALLVEPYAEAPGGQRLVQYFDKSRMEITQPGGDANALWHVTNGLLVRELIGGQLQTGDSRFEPHEPAQINVAGDADDSAGPTYATFASRLNDAPLADGALITQRIDRAGNVSDDPALASFGVVAAQRLTVPGIDHQIASVFWEFMNSTGLVYADGDVAEAPLFENPYYAAGYPLTEAYWTTVRVAGVERDVLLQCFERRCLTWTPDNAEGWKVEAGNVGQHYVAWRYGQLGLTQSPAVAPTTGDVRVTAVVADPPGNEGQEEAVEITNFDAQAIDLTGWTLQDASGNRYTFPAFTLALGASVEVRACHGVDSASVLYTGKCSPIWNNSGDTAYLYDASGALVNSYSY